MKPTSSRHRKHLTTATLLGLSLSLAACTSPVSEPAATTPAPPAPSTSTPSATPTPSETAHAHASDDPAKVELALEAAKIMTTWDPTKDFNRTEAEKRARKLMTDERAKQVIAPERPATGEEWLNAAAKKATSKPSVKIMTEHHEKDSIAVKATWQWVTDGGESWAGEESTTFFFTFTDKAPYKIRDYTAE
ncbi:MAG: hypothetical protein ACTH2A_12930 [Glutamicibacter ardleyensis]